MPISGEAATSLRVDVLGAPLITVAGKPLQVDTRKAVALLAVLAVAASRDEPAVTRASCAELLWPEVDEARARATLRRTLSVLIAATGPAVSADRAAIWLDPAQVQSDVVTFRALARSSDRDDLARAVGLVRGELLAGFALRDNPVFEDWARSSSDALGRELGAVLERLVLDRLRHGELHAALADAARWLELDPLHEAAHRSLMRLLAWTGRRQEALKQYERCVRILGDELGVAPVRATTEVYEAIRSGSLPPPKRRATTPVLAPVSEAAGVVALTGRDLELAQLRGTLGAGGRLVVVTGEAGVGRSRLVEHFADGAGQVVLARAHGGEAALSFAPIADLLRAAIAVGGPVADPLAREVARLAPELRPDGPGEPFPATLGAQDRFFDAVARVLAGCGAAAVVVEDVHAAGAASAEVLAYLMHRLDRLPCPLVLTWRDPGLPDRHPVQMALSSGRLASRVSRIALGRLSRTDTDALATAHNRDPDAIWRDTAGLPLLLAAALRSGGGELASTVREVLAGRLAEVSQETGQVLGALAVLDGVAQPPELQATSGRTEVETVEAVEEALRAGLLREEAGGLAFAHDALRRVAYDQLSLLRRRLLHRRAAEALAAGRSAVEQSGEIASHFHLGGNDEAAASWALRAAARSRELFAHSEALHQLQFAASLGRDDADCALARGDVLVALARYEPARQDYARALALTVEPARRAAIERRLADVAVRLGEWSAAANGLRTALELVGEDEALRARLLADLAVVGLRAGDLAEARVRVVAALVAGQSDPYLRDVAGMVASAGGDLDTALEHFESALRALADQPDSALEVAVRNNLAVALGERGDHSSAIAMAETALELGRRLGDRHRLAALHANLADRLHERSGEADAQQAKAHLLESAALFAEVGADPLSRPDIWTLSSW